MKFTALVAFFLLCSFGGLAPAMHAEPSLPEISSPFGLNAGVANRFYSEAEREHAAQMLAQAGVSWVREEFCWSCMDWSPHQANKTYHWQVNDWFDYDQMMPLVAERHINVLGLLDYGPGADVRTGRAYRRQSCPSDADAAPIDAWLPAWREFVRAVVSRYQAHIKYWEVQNEPTSQCFWRKVDLSAPGPNAADYVKVLRAAADVIRQTDPQARIVLAGLSPEIDPPGVDYFQFLRQVQEAGGWPYFDIVAVHPYRTPFAPEQFLPRSRFNVTTLRMDSSSHEYDLQGELSAFEQLMMHWGRKPLWLTEIGWSVHSLEPRARERGAQPEIVQADYLIRSYIQAIAAGVQVVMWYDFRDDAVPNLDESSFGMLYRDFSPKPVYHAFSTLAHLLAGTQFQAQVRGGGSPNLSNPAEPYEYRFVKGSQHVVVLWRSTDQGAPLTVTVDNIRAPTARVIGPELAPFTVEAGRIVTPTNGTLTLEITERPIFVVFDAGQLPKAKE